MTQSIVIQVGQCGNQIGSRFWDLALREHASVNQKGLYDSALSTFFINGNNETQRGLKEHISGLKARAVLIDMEEGVVGELLKGPLRNIFDHRQLITDVSGSGNNWAVGHCMYGPKYRAEISESIRRAAELCDCLQCFFLIHSMGGGTGSGLGTFVTRLVEDEYPDVYRFVTAVYPSNDDDVITSPYNSVLAMRNLTESADCVLPIENHSLGEIVKKIQEAAPKSNFGKRVYRSSSVGAATASVISSEGGTTRAKDEKPFDAMNNIVANLMLNLTCSARFEGTLNVDLNEISMNLVPFPQLHYLVAAQSPLYTLPDVVLPPRKIDQMFSDSFTKDFQLINADPRAHTYLACALLLRGQIDISDIRRNIDRFQQNLRFVPWNQDGWKVGHCSVAPSGQKYALLNLANNACVRHNFTSLLDRMNKLYKRKAHIHHYNHIDGFESSLFDESVESLKTLREEYAQLDSQGILYGENLPEQMPRLQIAN